MKRRLIALAFTLILLVSLGMQGFAADYGSEVNTTNIVEGGKRMYSNFEGNYDSVVPSDSGAVGMGILGWRGSKALELMKMICEKAPSYAKNILGTTFYNEIVSAPSTGWSSRTLNSTEAANVRTLLRSSYSVEAQNELARTDIIRQIGEAYKQGIRSDAAILYYCSVSNHYGPGGAINFMTSVRAAMGISSGATINSLDEFHDGVLKAAKTYSNVASTVTYRTGIYNYIKNTLHWSTTGGASTAVTPLTPTFTPDNGSGSGSFTTVLGFTDVSSGSWAYAGIEYVVNQGLFKGITSTTFAPSMTMTRGMVVTVLYRMSNQQSISIGGISSSNMYNPFSDVDYGKYYYDAVLWANSFSIVNGMTSNTFQPENPVTREQLAVMMYRFAEYRGRTGSGSTNAAVLNQFIDGGNTSSYAKKAMAWAVSTGLISGVKSESATLLDPQGLATRAQVATIIMRFARNIA